MDELFEFHHANILLLEPDNKTLKVVASRGYENQAVGGRVQVGTGVIGVVARKRQMMHVSNLGQQRAYAAAQRREMEKSDRRGQLGDAIPVPGLPNAESQIAIPLLIRDDLIGVFSIESPCHARSASTSATSCRSSATRLRARSTMHGCTKSDGRRRRTAGGQRVARSSGRRANGGARA